MKRVLYLACFLAVVSALAGGLLGFVNDMTFARIQESKIAAEKESLVKIFPNGDFIEVEFKDDTGLIEKVFEAKGEGYVYKLNVQGRDDVITFVVGFGTDNKIAGYYVISQKESFGDKFMTDDFTNSIVGKNSNDGIATVSGATLSTSAIVSGIDAAKAHYNAMNGITGEGAAPEPVKPTLTLGTKYALNSEDVAKYKGEVLSTSEEGTVVTYLVKVNGYGMVDDDGSHGLSYVPNEIEVKIDKETKTVVGIKYVTFGDTEGFGDKTMADEYYALFEGLSIEDQSVEIDTVSSATCTSKSVISAVRIAMDAASK